MVKQSFHVMATFYCNQNTQHYFPNHPHYFSLFLPLLYIANAIFHFPISIIYALAYALAGVETTKQFDSVWRQKLPAP